jgi:hypothetical protein
MLAGQMEAQLAGNTDHFGFTFPVILDAVVHSLVHFGDARFRGLVVEGKIARFADSVGGAGALGTFPAEGDSRTGGDPSEKAERGNQECL